MGGPYGGAAAPADTAVRVCQFSFCRQHGSRAVSDSQGKLTVTIHDAEVVQRYRFGLATADYFLCGRCGVYVVAVLTDGDGLYGIAIVNALDNAEQFTQASKPADYSAEGEADRQIGRASCRERVGPYV